MVLGIGVGVGVGIGVGVVVGGAMVGEGAGAGFDEAPTLPQPAIISMAAAETMAAGILKRCRKTYIAVTVSVTCGSADFMGLIDGFPQTKGRGNGGTAFASFGANLDKGDQVKRC
jgi:hypothetical protein